MNAHGKGYFVDPTQRYEQPKRYLIRSEDVPRYPPIRAKWLGDHRPASMLVIVPGLVWPNILIEIEAYAVAPPHSRSTQQGKYRT